MKDMGLATHFVTSSSVPEIEHTLVALGKVSWQTSI